MLVSTSTRSVPLAVGGAPPRALAERALVGATSTYTDLRTGRAEVSLGLSGKERDAAGVYEAKNVANREKFLAVHEDVWAGKADRAAFGHRMEGLEREAVQAEQGFWMGSGHADGGGALEIEGRPAAEHYERWFGEVSEGGGVGVAHGSKKPKGSGVHFNIGEGTSNVLSTDSGTEALKAALKVIAAGDGKSGGGIGGLTKNLAAGPLSPKFNGYGVGLQYQVNKDLSVFGTANPLDKKGSLGLKYKGVEVTGSASQQTLNGQQGIEGKVGVGFHF